MQPSSFIETSSGRRFQPLNPIIADIYPCDIAHHLSNQCRFSGAADPFYSVAEHCVRVSELLQVWGEDTSVQLWGLLHDASEAYLVDIPTPLKELEEFAAYRTAEERLMKAVCYRFGLALRMPAVVRRADQTLLATEARDLMPFRPEHWSKLEQRPLPERIVPWSSETAERNFLALYGRLAA